MNKTEKLTLTGAVLVATLLVTLALGGKFDPKLPATTARVSDTEHYPPTREGDKAIRTVKAATIGIDGRGKSSMTVAGGVEFVVHGTANYKGRAAENRIRVGDGWSAIQRPDGSFTVKLDMLIGMDPAHHEQATWDLGKSEKLSALDDGAKLFSYIPPD